MKRLVDQILGLTGAAATALLLGCGAGVILAAVSFEFLLTRRKK
jgi:hypothetical protein